MAKKSQTIMELMRVEHPSTNNAEKCKKEKRNGKKENLTGQKKKKKKSCVQSQSPKRHYSPQLKKPPLGPTTPRASSISVHSTARGTDSAWNISHSDTTF